ncbi:solute carrier family 7 member 13-like isoform X2 [Camelus ferus]|uniref:Solute carrier family 7 member 13-like isoform X2 n=2 Tax=Camelus TaxID=9836 RepID=A0A8B8S9Q0_CAMFR|nr:solute carrier family 7 member 13 isoform X2 [Camelus dromedarius]XP_032326192.1 solute carrier family 7 member 13-like isoform X2 [Camelus ferus]
MKMGGSTQLQRVIGYFHGTIFLFSIIIGAGIFVAPKGVLKYSSLNVGVSLSIWAACAVVSTMAALSHAELGTTFPRSGAQYYFLKRSLGPFIAFFYLWINLFSTPAGIAARGLLLAGYITQPFYPGCFVPEMPKKCLALAILWCLGILNARGVKEVTWFQTVSTVVKMTVLCFVSVTGLVLVVRGRKENLDRFEKAFDGEVPNASQIAEAFLQGLYAYSGWGVLVRIAGELKNPSETIPKCVITALTLVALIYLLVNVSYIAVLTPREIISSDLILLINYVGFTDWIQLGLMMTGLLKLRYQEPHLSRPYKVRLPFVFGTIAVSLFLVLTPVIKSPQMHHIYVLLFILSGLLFYLPFVHFNLGSTYFNKITCFLQLLLNVSPADDTDEYISTEETLQKNPPETPAKKE